jgi:hypothetical protein
VVVVPILFVIGSNLVQGAGAINWEFLTAAPSNGMKAAALSAIGVPSADPGYGPGGHPRRRRRSGVLSEYAADTWFTGHSPGHHQPGRRALDRQWPVSVRLFVLFLNFGTSLLAGALTSPS